MNRTNIGWTDYTWNPVTGCLHGCSYCYARRMARRFGKDEDERAFRPKFHPDRLGAPLSVKRPSRVFVCSMADLFGEWVPQDWIAEALYVIEEEAPQHTYQFLTKNPARYADFGWPENAWLGATATCQAELDEAMDVLEYLDAPVKFISAEPMLARIDLLNWRPDWLIIGPQTGPGAPPVPTGRIRDLMVQAQALGVPVFVKAGIDGPKEFPEVTR